MENVRSVLKNIGRNLSEASLKHLNNEISSMQDNIQVAVDALSVKIEHEETRARFLDKFHEIQKFCSDFDEEMSTIETDKEESIVTKIKKLEVCCRCVQRNMELCCKVAVIICNLR